MGAISSLSINQFFLPSVHAGNEACVERFLVVLQRRDGTTVAQQGLCVLDLAMLLEMRTGGAAKDLVVQL